MTRAGASGVVGHFEKAAAFLASDRARMMTAAVVNSSAAAALD